MGDLSKSPNIGEVLECQLAQVGIETMEQLKEIGSIDAWARIKTLDPSVCFNSLCALEGAVQGIRWHYLSKETKAMLKEYSK